MNKKIAIVLVIIIVIVGSYVLFKGPKAQAPTTETPTTSVPNSTENTETENMENEDATVLPAENIITYTGEGYSPDTLTIKLGETVTWKNESSSGMWTASAMHPSHIVYSGTSLQEHCPDDEEVAFDACGSVQPGNSWSFTFNKQGTWKYHNHLIPKYFGTIVVE